MVTTRGAASLLVGYKLLIILWRVCVFCPLLSNSRPSAQLVCNLTNG